MKEQGFTLIEALLALALGAMVMAVVLSSLKTASATAERAGATVADAEAFSRAGDVLAGDMTHSLWIDDGEGRPIFRGASDQVLLPELPRPFSPSPFPPAPVAVEYRLTLTALGRTRLTRAQAPLSAGRLGDFDPATPLWSAPGRYEFRFLDAKGKWLAQWTDQHSLPQAVALTLPTEERPILVAALPDLLPVSCADGPSMECPLPSELFP